MRRVKQAKDWQGPGLSRLEAAHYLGVCPRTLDEWRARGSGPAWVRIGARVTYWREALDAHIAQANLAGATRECPERDFAFRVEPTRSYSVVETCRLLQVSPRTLAYWRERGLGPAWRREGNALRYCGSDLFAYLQVEAANDAEYDNGH